MEKQNIIVIYIKKNPSFSFSAIKTTIEQNRKIFEKKRLEEEKRKKQLEEKRKKQLEKATKLKKRFRFFCSGP